MIIKEHRITSKSSGGGLNVFWFCIGLTRPADLGRYIQEIGNRINEKENPR